MVIVLGVEGKGLQGIADFHKKPCRIFQLLKLCACLTLIKIKPKFKKFQKWDGWVNRHACF